MENENLAFKSKSFVEVNRGAQVTEQALLDRLRPLLAEPAAAVKRPIRIVVSSGSQRDHLAARLVATLGRPLLGIRIQTHFRLALEVLERARCPHPRGTLLLDFLIRRFAAEKPPLSSVLDQLEDGYGAVLGSVRDFLDAGFEAVHFEPIDELLHLEGKAQDGRHRAEIERIRSLLGVTLTTRLALDELGFDHRSTVLRKARDLLNESSRWLPCRALFIHGFADATGVVTDLLETLLRQFSGVFFLDQPPDPAVPGRCESAYTLRLFTRLATFAPSFPEVEDRVPPQVEVLNAPDPNSEICAIANRITALLEDGEDPERIAVVARNLDPYGLLIRRRFQQAGVPFSSRGAKGPLQPEQRQHRFLLELLKHGPRIPIERWLEHWQPTAITLSQAERGDLFIKRGIGRLADALDFEEDLENDETARTSLQAAGALAQALLTWNEATEPRPLRHHVQQLESIVDQHLAWSGERDARRSLAEALTRITDDLPTGWLMTTNEFTDLLTRQLSDAAAATLGGEGGGVQVLDALEARALTFQHLFLIGLQHNLFPRPVHEDPLISDTVRTLISKLLPDLPIKATGFDEERYLFAQLLSSAPRVTLSWPRKDGFGKPLTASPLLERWREHAVQNSVAPPPDLIGHPNRKPITERLEQIGIHASRDQWTAALNLASESVLKELSLHGEPPVTAIDLAHGRRVVIEELDPDLTTRPGRARASRLGPYFGFIGRPRHIDDPRQRDLYVTTLENLAACPWQTFLTRLLHLQPTPDVLASLPRLRGKLLGQLVHQTLEILARRSVQPSPSPTWADDESLDQLLFDQARGLLLENGLRLDGLARAAARLARPYLETARQQDWDPEPPPVLAIEEEGHCKVRHGQTLRIIRFKADRVDASADGPRRTDYKTGGRASSRQALLTKVRMGRWLQLAAYMYGSPQANSHQPGSQTRSAEPSATGRYLFLRPDLAADQRSVEARTSDADIRRAFEETAPKLLDLWDAGTFFPRLLQPREDLEPQRCSHCELREACLRRDSGSRARLRRWSESTGGPLDRIMKTVWDLELSVSEL